MTQMDRKGFVKVAGAGSVAAAVAAGIPFASKLSTGSDNHTLSFRAAAALPEHPLPGYATQLVEGTVNLDSGTGLVTTRVLAGHPDDTGIVGLPGLSRIVRITHTSADSGRYTLTGLIDDRSQLRRGEPAKVTIVIDTKTQTVHAPFLGRQQAHALTA